MNKLTKQQLIVLIGAAFYQMALLGTLVNSSSVLLAQIRQEYGFSMTRISFYLTLKSVASALSGTLCAKYFFKTNQGLFMLCAILVNVSAYFLLLPGADTIAFYISSVLQGISISLSAVMIPYLIQKWFPNNTGTATGIAMASSGLGGIAFNLIVSALIQASGWKGAIVIVGLITIVIAIPSVLAIFHYPAPLSAGQSQSRPSRSSTKKGNFETYSFLLCTLLFLGGYMALQFAQYISIYAQSIGYSLAVGAVLASLLMVGNVAGKFVFGFLCDVIGIWNSIMLSLALIIFSASCLTFLPGILPLLYVAALLFGIVYALVMISISQVCTRVYGVDESQGYIGLHNSLNYVFGAAFSVGVGFLYDMTQSFITLLLLIAAVCLVSLFATIILKKREAGD